MSSAMTEVAVRLAEPDRGAEQAAASLGQAVRRQVSFMNEAISRALGRAGELEALVHNEVAALEKSYGENEHKIKGLIQELVGERHALVSTTDKVSETLKSMGSEVPNLIEKLSQQQIKLAKIIEGAGQNLIALENQLSTASGSLETSLANRTQQLQAVLDDYTVALDATLASRAEALDIQLVERTRALDAAFAERLSLFDDSLRRSTIAIDGAVSEKARALTYAMENHVKSLSDTLGRQAHNLDESMMTGIDAVRRTSDSITRQSLQAIEGLSSRADLLKNVSDNLVHQISGVTNRFDNQGNSIVQAASALEHANARIDSTLQKRHSELNDTLNRMSGKADQLDQVMRGYYADGGRQHRQRRGARAPAPRAARQRHRRPFPGGPRRARPSARADGRATPAPWWPRSSGSGTRPRCRPRARSRTCATSSPACRRRSRSTSAASPAASTRPPTTCARAPRAPPPSCTWSRSACAPRPSACRSRRARARTPCAPRSAISCARWSSCPRCPPASAATSPRRAAVPCRTATRCRSRPPTPSSRACSCRPPRRTAAATTAGRSATCCTAPRRMTTARSEPAPSINTEVIARALDATTASAIWSRFRAGQRGIMVRSIYTAEGRATFDEMSERYKTDRPSSA